MKQWITSLCIFYINSRIFFQRSLATTPLDYPGCVALTSDLVLQTGSKEELIYNSATRCASHCKGLQYTFSGTKDNWCYCGESTDKGIFASTDCNTKCPGDATEICGGSNSVSIRHTGYIKDTAVTPATSSQTDIKDANVTPRPTTLATSSQEDTTGSPSKGPNLTPMYISLPTVAALVTAVASAIAAVLRRRRRRSTKEQDEVSPQRENTPGGQSINLTINQQVAGSPQQETTCKNSDD